MDLVSTRGKKRPPFGHSLSLYISSLGGAVGSTEAFSLSSSSYLSLAGSGKGERERGREEGAGGESGEGGEKLEAWKNGVKCKSKFLVFNLLHTSVYHPAPKNCVECFQYAGDT